MEKTFIKLMDFNAKSPVFIGIDSISAVAQKGLSEIEIALNNGHHITAEIGFDRFEKLIQDFIYNR
jgi:hypothetical protein